MKCFVLGSILCLPIGLSAQQLITQIPVHATADFLKLPPNLYLGEVAGVAINSKGHIFVLSRGNTVGPAYAAAATQLLEFNEDGSYIREIGHNLYAWSYAHAVKVDKQDNIWVADKGSDMVIKFDPQGRVVMVFGRKQEASDEDTAPLGPGQFLQPHSIATDSHENVYVADRGNRRIQVFDGDGKYLREIHIDVPYDHSIHPWMGNMPDSSTTHTEQTSHADQRAPVNKTMQNGAPWAICITPGPDPVLFASDGYPGRVYKLKLDGTVLGVFGQSGHQPGQFGWIHEIACPLENKIYVAELLNWRLQMIVLEPNQMK